MKRARPSVPQPPPAPPKKSRTQHWLDRLFYISRAMTANVTQEEFAELKELLEKLRVQRDSKQFPEEP